MVRPLATTLLLFVAASTADAQEALPAQRLRRATSPTRDAGVLHLASGTWTRKVASASLGSDVIFDNTCPSGYFAALSGDTFVDEGRVPSPTSPDSLSSKPGCAQSYTVDGFQLAYCTDVPGAAQLQVAFFGSHPACATTIGVTPTASYAPPGLPGGTASGGLLCWTVTIDLAGSPGAFAMLADGDGTYAGPPTSNLFGWSIRCALPWSQQASTGPVIAGDPSFCSYFDGTVWDPAYDPLESGTGMGSLGQFRIENGPTPPGCYWFEHPFPSFHLELYADACPLLPDMTAFCLGEIPGAPTPCPCANGTPQWAAAGCRNSTGLGARLRGTGVPSVAGDTLRLVADQMPTTTSALFFQGTQRAPVGQVFGDGLRCAGGTATRLGVKAAAGGAATFPGAGDPAISVLGGVTAAGTRAYQVWYRNSAAFCTPAVFNLSNGWEVAWTP